MASEEEVDATRGRSASAPSPVDDRGALELADRGGRGGAAHRHRAPRRAPAARRRSRARTDTIRVGDPDDGVLANEYAGEETPGRQRPTPDQNDVDAIGRAYGLQEEDAGALRSASEILARRDRRRSELIPPAPPGLVPARRAVAALPGQPLPSLRGAAALRDQRPRLGLHLLPAAEALPAPARRGLRRPSCPALTRRRDDGPSIRARSPSPWTRPRAAGRPPARRLPPARRRPRRRRQGGGGHRSRARHPRAAPRRVPRTGATAARRRACRRERPGSRRGSSIPTTARATTWSAGAAARSPSASCVDGRPVLGVVFAFAYPDDRGDLFAWAEGAGPLRRNGVPVRPSLPARLGPDGRRPRLQQGRPRSRGQPAQRAPGPLPEPASHRASAGPGGRGRGGGDELALRARAPGTTAAGDALLRGGGRRARRRGRPRGDLRRDRRQPRRGPRSAARRAVAEALARPSVGNVGAGPWTEPRPAHLERGRGDRGRGAARPRAGLPPGPDRGRQPRRAGGVRVRGRARAGTRTGRARSWTADAGTCSPGSPPTTARWRWRWRARSWPAAGTIAAPRARGLPRVAGARRLSTSATPSAPRSPAHRPTAQPGQRLAHAREPARRPRASRGRWTRPPRWRGRTARSRTPPVCGDAVAAFVVAVAHAIAQRRRGRRPRTRTRWPGRGRAPTPRWSDALTRPAARPPCATARSRLGAPRPAERVLRAAARAHGRGGRGAHGPPRRRHRHQRRHRGRAPRRRARPRRPPRAVAVDGPELPPASRGFAPRIRGRCRTGRCDVYGAGRAACSLAGERRQQATTVALTRRGAREAVAAVALAQPVAGGHGGGRIPSARSAEAYS